ncbi:MAG: Amino acid permease family protein [candidate division TM6 bacterium GW2011_GWF2_43_87]|nr:MAG: Amino acid permease family protein [candidate division TM6 bacterium GW2011_GWF2_43_87]
MSSSNRLSLTAAVFVNINIMLGSGIFINSILLAQKAGPLSTLIYPAVGLLILPLIVAFSTLLSHFPGGTFYEFGAHIHPLLGFVSSWGYFIGKLASAALSIHFSMMTVQQLIPLLQVFNTIVLDILVLVLFVLLNMFNVKTGRPIQYFFVALKTLAISIAVGAALALFNVSHFSSVLLPWAALPGTVPFVLFAFAGFEASCSLSKNIENPSKNAPRAILFSYGIVLAIITLYQLCLYGALGEKLGALDKSAFLMPYSYMLDSLFMLHPSIRAALLGAALAGIAMSAFGASYSILYSNVWNLHTLSGYNVVPFSALLRKLNRFYAPVACIIVAGLLEMGYLLGSGGQIAPLQIISATATVLSYTISALAFVAISFNTLHKLRMISVLSLLCCVFFMITSVFNAWAFGVVPYLIFGLALLVGLLMTFSCRKTGREVLEGMQ